MSTQIFPTLPGLGFNFNRSPIWSNMIQTATSGKEVAIAFWSYPKYMWELTYEVLRSDPSLAELQSLMGFFNSRQGQFDTFLFNDLDDNSVVGASLGVGDGATTVFQLVRAYGGFIEPMLAPNVITAVKVNGTPTGAYTVSAWGSANPGQITFTTAPANGAVITADYTFYWPCRFTDDTLTFNKFMNLLWSNDSVKFRSVK